MKIALVANGSVGKHLLLDIGSADLVIGVDRGAYRLLKSAVTPNVAIGDFDSTSVRELREVKKKVRDIRAFPSEKDETDLDLAIDYAISLNPEEVVIYGAIGSRFDHTLVAVNLLEQLLKKNISAIIRDRHNEVFLLKSRRTIINSIKYRYLSILAYSTKARVTLRGVLYPVTKHVFHRTMSLGVSNEIVGKEAEVIVHSGIAVVIQSRDGSK